MASRVGTGLLAEGGKVATVVVEDDGCRLVYTNPSVSQQAIPELRILAAPRRAGAQTLVESAHPLERLAPYGHVGARPDASYSRRPTTIEKSLIKAVGAESPAQAAEDCLEHQLGLGGQFRWQHEPGGGLYRRVGKGCGQPGQPTRMNDRIVIEKGDHLRGGGGHRGVAGTAEARPLHADVAHGGEPADHPARSLLFSVIHHDDLGW